MASRSTPQWRASASITSSANTRLSSASRRGNPRSAEAWFAAGWAEHLAAGRASVEAEVEPYEQCVALEPDHYLALRNLGQALYKARGDADGAEKMYRAAIRHRPRDAPARFNLGVLLRDARGDAPAAEIELAKAAALDRYHVPARCHLAALRRARGDASGAEDGYAEVGERERSLSYLSTFPL